MPDSNERPMIVEDCLRRRSTNLQCFDHRMILGTDRVGIEIELENLPEVSAYGYDRRLTHWNIVSDGSLRNNGMEFITKGDGVGGDVLYKAAIEIEEYLSKLNPDPSWRCSTHVHVDVRDLNVQQLKLFVLAYAYFERFLFKENGWKRYKSNFCVPLGLAQQQVQIVADIFQTDTVSEFIAYAQEVWPKYTAMNLCTANSLGTFEFRMPMPTYSAVGLAKTANRFLALKRLAKEWEGGEVGFLDAISSMDLRSVFQKSVGRSTVFTDEDRSFGYGLARDIISITDLKAKTYKILNELNKEPREERGRRSNPNMFFHE